MSASGAASEPQGKFDVILADPPWKFRSYDQAKVIPQRAAVQHYPVMELEEICQLPVQDLAADPCALFLWVTWPTIEQAFKVIRSWGFTYRTLGFLWVKAKRSGFGFFTGLGYYTRSNTEACLLAAKGYPPIDDRSVSQLIYSPVREHSRKPDEQYGKIERLFPQARCLELFARRHREGWSAWGNEVESDVELTGPLV